jgi:hypothetical protein
VSYSLLQTFSFGKLFFIPELSTKAACLHDAKWVFGCFTQLDEEQKTIMPWIFPDETLEYIAIDWSTAAHVCSPKCPALSAFWAPPLPGLSNSRHVGSQSQVLGAAGGTK